MSRKLEKIARQYGIDPATLPPVDGKSVTINTPQSPAQPTSTVAIPQSREAQQSERERLRVEAIATNRRLRDHQRAVRDQLIAARSR